MADYTSVNKQFINGKWTEGNDKMRITDLNPFNDEEILSLAGASIEDVDDAFAAAKASTQAWANSNPLFRRDILLRAASILNERKEEFIKWLSIEVGSPYLKGAIEVQQAHDILVEASSFATRMHGYTFSSTTDGKQSYVFRKPVGVVSLISPWNFPLYLSMRTIAPALGTGNAVVVKPASQSLVTGGTLIAKLLEEAGLPPGVFNVIVGRSEFIGDHFTAHPDSKLISFTGSTAVGSRIGRIAGDKIKKAALELGGNNPFIVLEDADINKVVDAAIFGRFLYQGQLCISVNRILVHTKLYEEFKTKFVQRARSLVHGNPTAPQTVIGPLIDKHALTRILGVIDQSIRAGAILETGNVTEKNILLPTVLSNVNLSMRIFTEEIFGPAVGLVPFSTDEEAVTLANATGYGLSGAVHTRDLYRGMQLARKIDTGMIHVNDQSANDEVHTPFGGEKYSGIGRFGGEFIMEEMTTLQWVSVQESPREYPF